MERLAEGWRPLPERSGGATHRGHLSGTAGQHESEPGAHRRYAVVLGILGIGLVFLGAAGFLWATTPQPRVVIDGAVPLLPRASAGLAQGAEMESAAAGQWLVDVQGGVARPGIVRLAPGSRVGEAIAEAGGYGPTADLRASARALNLAQPIEDGMKIEVPERGWSAGAAPTGAVEALPGQSAAHALIDLNSADQALLETLPGVGPVTAAKIIAAREEAPFASVDELDERGVVGPATLEKLRDLVTVAP